MSNTLILLNKAWCTNNQGVANYFQNKTATCQLEPSTRLYNCFNSSIMCWGNISVRISILPSLVLIPNYVVSLNGHKIKPVSIKFQLLSVYVAPTLFTALQLRTTEECHRKCNYIYIHPVAKCPLPTCLIRHKSCCLAWSASTIVSPWLCCPV